MKQRIAALLFFSFLLSCNDPGNSPVNKNDPLKKENDSLKNKTGTLPGDSMISVGPTGETRPVQDLMNAGIHPVSLQWISWEKKGRATITPGTDGWYTIKGNQSNKENDYLKIEGKIKRLSEKELEFEGTVETRVSHNNAGEPCIKKGKLRFFAKGNRTYYRMQDMENCAGGNLVDYVDIYPGNSSL